ncbi:hypothetical protein QQ045_013409 [Rhodiola kirilowii]
MFAKVKWFVCMWFGTIIGSGEESSKPSNGGNLSDKKSSGFQLPLNYPRFTKLDYEKMDEVRLKLLLAEYGLKFEGTIDELRAYANWDLYLVGSSLE